jgi:hypothetical protein
MYDMHIHTACSLTCSCTGYWFPHGKRQILNRNSEALAFSSVEGLFEAQGYDPRSLTFTLASVAGLRSIQPVSHLQMAIVDGATVKADYYDEKKDEVVLAFCQVARIFEVEVAAPLSNRFIAIQPKWYDYHGAQLVRHSLRKSVTLKQMNLAQDAAFPALCAQSIHQTVIVKHACDHSCQYVCVRHGTYDCRNSSCKKAKYSQLHYKCGDSNNWEVVDRDAGYTMYYSEATTLN